MKKERSIIKRKEQGKSPEMDLTEREVIIK